VCNSSCVLVGTIPFDCFGWLVFVVSVFGVESTLMGRLVVTFVEGVRLSRLSK